MSQEKTPQVNKGFYYEDDPNDFVFGSDQSLDAKFGGREILNISGDWSAYLPEKEPQSTTITETSGCVSFNTLNCIEILVKRLYDKNLNLSDRFVAKGSDTNPKVGNSPKKVADFIRKQWSVYESEYPFTPKMSVEEFYQTIPEKLFTLALGRGTEYEFGYEKIDAKDIKKALQYSPVGISVPAWYQDNDGKYYRPKGVRDGHWTVCYGMHPNGDLMVFDSYAPYQKVLRADCVPEVVFGYHLERQVKVESFWEKFLEILMSFFTKEPEAPKPIELTPREKVFESARNWFGKNARPLNLAPQDLGCAESLCTVVNSVDHDFPQDITYTPTLKSYLDKNPKYEQTLIYKPGCIIISPTQKSIGHVGVIGDDEMIYSNNSNTGLWDTHFTLDSWIKRYRENGGLRIYFYEPK